MTSLPTGIEPERYIRAQAREIRKLKDKLNRFAKLVPGSQRIWQLDSIAMELEFDAEEYSETEAEKAALNDQALFMRRLQWDLHQLRNTVRGPRGGRMTDTETYYMRERP